MRRRKGPRIYGPYQRGDRWIIAVAEGETRTDRSFESEAAALNGIREAEEELKLEGPITVEDALKEYEGWQARRAKRPASIATTMQRLRCMVAAGTESLRLAALVRERVEGRYVELSGQVSVDTHRNTLGEARTFGKWAVKRGYLRANPWAEVEAVGKRRKGKPKLRVDEARSFMAKCLELDDPAAVAGMCGLLLGFGASEIVERVGRDVDDGGAILWMDHGKTENRERHVEVPLLPEPLEPDWLRRKLAELAAAAGPAGYLWRAESRRSKKPHRDRRWVLDNVKRICRLAGVLEVTSHGLRGTQGTIAAAEGIVPQVVANALGNTEAVAKAHYIQPGAVATGRSKRALSVLAGGRK
jgi:integrase